MNGWLKNFCLVAGLVVPTTTTAQSPVTTTLELVSEGRQTNALIYDGLFDVYHITAVNPNDAPVTSLDIEITSEQLGAELIQTVRLAIKPGPDFWVPFTSSVPETFFVVPEHTGPADILVAPGTLEDSPTRLAAAFTVVGTTPLIPGYGVPTVIATISVASGSSLRNPCLGRGVIEGAFVDVGIPINGDCVPEPSAIILMGLAAAVFASRRPKHLA